MKQSVGVSKFKRASIPYIADEVQEVLQFAPGNTPPPPPREPTRSRRHRNLKLDLADAEIARCKWCGQWSLDYTCTHCTEHGYPTIDDLGRKRV